ncbi:type II toxin-antitoxin system RelE/ParE family toxin [Candidatus Poribacteria bacterium]|nr:type II toxin-antitoxin system RelE/ParE family toxin [Candidatus Poribacteria bacterium]
MEILWTPTARHTYLKILDYLEKAWTEKETQNFISEVDCLLEQLKQNPEMFEESRKKRNVRKGFVTKYNTLYYRVRPRKKELQLLVFWDNRQDPEKLPY